MSSRPDIRKPYVLLATWFGCGLLPKAPGTWGSLGALPFGVALLYYAGILALLAGIIIMSVVGYWASDSYEKAHNKHDAKEIVIDEVAGQWIALLPAALNPLSIVLAFALFRVFDVLKPWPVSWIDKQVKGPLGVMGDDILAGIFAAAAMIGLRYAGFG